MHYRFVRAIVRIGRVLVGFEAKIEENSSITRFLKGKTCGNTAEVWGSNPRAPTTHK